MRPPKNNPPKIIMVQFRAIRSAWYTDPIGVVTLNRTSKFSNSQSIRAAAMEFTKECVAPASNKTVTGTVFTRSIANITAWGSSSPSSSASIQKTRPPACGLLLFLVCCAVPGAGGRPLVGGMGGPGRVACGLGGPAGNGALSCFPASFGHSLLLCPFSRHSKHRPSRNRQIPLCGPPQY